MAITWAWKGCLQAPVSRQLPANKHASRGRGAVGRSCMPAYAVAYLLFTVGQHDDRPLPGPVLDAGGRGSRLRGGDFLQHGQGLQTHPTRTAPCAASPSATGVGVGEVGAGVGVGSTAGACLVVPVQQQHVVACRHGVCAASNGVKALVDLRMRSASALSVWSRERGRPELSSWWPPPVNLACSHERFGRPAPCSSPPLAPPRSPLCPEATARLFGDERDGHRKREKARQESCVGHHAGRRRALVYWRSAAPQACRGK